MNKSYHRIPQNEVAVSDALWVFMDNTSVTRGASFIATVFA